MPVRAGDTPRSGSGVPIAAPRRSTTDVARTRSLANLDTGSNCFKGQEYFFQKTSQIINIIETPHKKPPRLPEFASSGPHFDSDPLYGRQRKLLTFKFFCKHFGE